MSTIARHTPSQRYVTFAPNDARINVVAPGVMSLRTLMVNVFLLGGREGQSPWILVDAGIPGYASAIVDAAHACFGERPPSAIILTHGHLDHRGSLEALLRVWPVPVFAHPLEFPYLTGELAYPPPDPTVGGGLMAALSPLYPRAPIDITSSLRPLSDDGRVPGLDEWQWLHTPGHSLGHVSLFRASDRVVVAGDAVVTTKQESLSAVVTQRAEVCPPPAYYTIDWTAAEESVRVIEALEPEVLATGHGPRCLAYACAPSFGSSRRASPRSASRAGVGTSPSPCAIVTTPRGYPHPRR